MKFYLSILREYCPALPISEHKAVTALDDAGIEVQGIESDEIGTDTIVSVELLANRGDHRCYLGVARELAGRLDGVVAAPEGTPLSIATRGSISCRVSTSDCLTYMLTPLDVLDHSAPLGAESRQMLAIEGGETGAAVVDAANAVSLQIGQPLHAFDADTIRGTIDVRHSLPGETARLLGEENPRPLPAGTLVIADDAKILAIAGVIGCEESRVTPATSRVILESATFDPVAVRRSSSALGVVTSASQRFERGGDPALPAAGAALAVKLLEESGAARASGPSTMARAWEADLPVIRVDFADLADFLGTDIPPGEAADRLERYGIKHLGGGDFKIPSHRIWDLVQAQDLYEEVARSIGYNCLPSVLPVARIGAEPAPAEQGAEVAGDVLVSLGFYEVITDGFYDRALVRRLGVQPGSPLDRHVSTVNAVERHYELLKNNSLAQAMAALETNARYRTTDVRLYEFTRVFEPASTGVCERGVLWAIAAGSANPGSWSGGNDRPVDVFFLKGATEQIAARLRFRLEARPIARSGHVLAPYLHPHRSMVLSVGDRTAGVIGEVHPQVAERFDVAGSRPVYLELDTAVLVPHERPVLPVLEEAPPIERMLDFVVPTLLTSRDLIQVLNEAAPRRLRGLHVADVFENSSALGAGMRSITFRLLLSAEPTPTSEELNVEVQAMIDMVVAAFSEYGVRLR